MPVRIHFSKFFLSGNLKGLTVYDSISFVNNRAAQIWMDGVSRGSKKYIITLLTCKD